MNKRLIAVSYLDAEGCPQVIKLPYKQAKDIYKALLCGGYLVCPNFNLERSEEEHDNTNSSICKKS